MTRTPAGGFDEGTRERVTYACLWVSVFGGSVYVCVSVSVSRGGIDRGGERAHDKTDEQTVVLKQDMTQLSVWTCVWMCVLPANPAFKCIPPLSITIGLASLVNSKKGPPRSISRNVSCRACCTCAIACCFRSSAMRDALASMCIRACFCVSMRINSSSATATNAVYSHIMLCRNANDVMISLIISCVVVVVVDAIDISNSVTRARAAKQCNVMPSVQQAASHDTRMSCGFSTPDRLEREEMRTSHAGRGEGREREGRGGRVA